MLFSEALLLFLIHLLFGWRKHLVLPALDFSKSGPSAITHTIKDQRFLISFVDFKDFSTSYSLKIRLDFRIISNSSIVTVTALILVLLSWDILPMDFALPVICTISCHFGHFVEVVYMSAWYDKWLFSLIFFLLNVNAGMQAVQGVQSLLIGQGPVYNKMFITSADGGYVTVGICFSVSLITQKVLNWFNLKFRGILKCAKEQRTKHWWCSGFQRGLWLLIFR